MVTILYYVNNFILKIYLEKIYVFIYKNGLFRYRFIKYGKVQLVLEVKRLFIKIVQEEIKVCIVFIILLKYEVYLLNICIYNFFELFSQFLKIKMYVFQVFGILFVVLINGYFFLNIKKDVKIGGIVGMFVNVVIKKVDVSKK